MFDRDQGNIAMATIQCGLRASQTFRCDTSDSSREETVVVVVLISSKSNALHVLLVAEGLRLHVPPIPQAQLQQSVADDADADLHLVQLVRQLCVSEVGCDATPCFHAP